MTFTTNEYSEVDGKIKEIDVYVYQFYRKYMSMYIKGFLSILTFMLITVGDIATMLNISRGTVRAWTAEFAEYLSVDANPDKGEVRSFDDNDVRVFYYVWLRRGQHVGYSEILAELAQKKHKDVDMPNLSEQPIGKLGEIEQSGMISSSTLEKIAAQFEARIKALEDERSYLRGQLEKERAARLEAEKRVAYLEAKLE